MPLPQKAPTSGGQAGPGSQCLGELSSNCHDSPASHHVECTPAQDATAVSLRQEEPGIDEELLEAYCTGVRTLCGTTAWAVALRVWGAAFAVCVMLHR